MPLPLPINDLMLEPNFFIQYRIEDGDVEVFISLSLLYAIYYDAFLKRYV